MGESLYGRALRDMLRPHPRQKRLVVERLGRAGPLGRDQRVLQRLHLGFVLFEQARARPYDLAGRFVTARLHLRVDQAGEVIAEGDLGVLAHGLPHTAGVHHLLVTREAVEGAVRPDGQGAAVVLDGMTTACQRAGAYRLA